MLRGSCGDSRTDCNIENKLDDMSVDQDVGCMDKVLDAIEFIWIES